MKLGCFRFPNGLERWDDYESMRNSIAEGTLLQCSVCQMQPNVVLHKELQSLSLLHSL